MRFCQLIPFLEVASFEVGDNGYTGGDVEGSSKSDVVYGSEGSYVVGEAKPTIVISNH